MVDIATTLPGLKLKNPTILAAGILGETGASLENVAKAGAGAVVTKSIGIEPREGHGNPTFVETEHGIINAMGLPNPGIDNYKDEVESIIGTNIPVIGSIFGADAQEFEILAVEMEKFGVSALELNLSCPHAKGYGAILGHDKEKVLEITKVVKGAVKVPVYVKLSPNVSNIAEIACAVEDAEGDGIVAINTISAMAIDIDMALPILSNAIGGLSGPGIKPIGLRCIYEIKAETELPVIGVGGILSGNDAIEYIMAGASAVQIGSGVYYKGIGIFSKVCQQIQEFMDAHSYKTIKEMVGIAQKG
ncbi:MAG: dihydroorotate dehydrogenase [Thermoplasmata archaeon]|nr:MAG: dihydroorotate dehydrogenase [Thermoplasmata archaeon]